MLTIYHYFRDFPPTAARFNGGMEKAVAGLAAGTVQATQHLRGSDAVQCCVLCEGPNDLDTVRPEGYRVRCFDNRTTEHKRFGMAPTLQRFLENDLRDGIVVLHAIFHPTVNLISRILRRTGVPYIIAPHDPYHPSMFQANRWKKNLYWHCLERPMLRRAVAVQVLDQRHEIFLRERGVQTPVIEVGNGFLPEEVPAEGSLSWRSSGPLRILFLGRIDRINKGLDLLVQAFAPIAAKHPDAKLTIQGPDRGDGDAMRDHIARLGLTDRVDLLGPDFETRPGDLIARHDIFVLPSRFEGFGLAAVEAMLAARPILISEIAGLAPHVSRCDCGVVVDAEVDSIRYGIEQLIEKRPQWQSLGMRGREHVLQNLNWAHIAGDALVDYRRFARHDEVSESRRGATMPNPDAAARSAIPSPRSTR